MAKRCLCTLLGYNASPDIANKVGETADHRVIRAEEQRRNGEYVHMRAYSSSPFQPHDGPNHSYLQYYHHQQQKQQQQQQQQQ